MFPHIPSLYINSRPQFFVCITRILLSSPSISASSLYFRSPDFDSTCFRIKLKMQRNTSIVHGGMTSDYSMSQFLDQSDGYDCASRYSAFPSISPLFSVTPPVYSRDENTRPVDLPPYPLTRSEMLREHQDLMDRRDWCLSHLRKATKEAEALRQDNINLQMANIELTNRYSHLIKASPRTIPISAPRSSALVDDLRRLSLKEKAARSHRRLGNKIAVKSTTSESENDSIESNRVSLPKSISVRSKGYLKTAQTVDNNGRIRRAPFKSVNDTQKVYISGGGKKKEEALEVKVYKQGVTKTELCNKWQQTGSCPYGDDCQFAHGIVELRPVLRHPRYKTQVCRMVLNGDPCPYAHRCHFRHSLTEEEKQISSTKC